MIWRVTPIARNDSGYFARYGEAATQRPASTLASTWARGVFRVVILMAHDSVRPHMGCLQAPASRQLHEQTLGRGDGDTAIQRAVRRDAGRGSRGVMWRLCGGLQLEKWDQSCSHLFPTLGFLGEGCIGFPKSATRVMENTAVRPRRGTGRGAFFARSNIRISC